jgi:outer membrane protein OmpA-like peptidoglycan-associated protein
MCFHVRHSTLAILLIFCLTQARAQSSRCDSIQWNFDVNQFAIDGDNLMADFADKGWTPDFFQSNEIDVTIYGATDCPGSYTYNSKLAGNRALYLRNYFEVSAFPRLTIVDSYTIPERNCVKPNQGYNRPDRVTSLKVCWSGEEITANTTAVVIEKNRADEIREEEKERVAEQIVSAVSTTSEEKERVAEQNVSTAAVTTEEKTAETETTQTTTTQTEELKQTDGVEVVSNAKEEGSAIDSVAVAVNVTTETIVNTEVPTDSLATTRNETTTSVAPLATDSALTIVVDSALVKLPTKPKKVFDLESSPELNVGDELIIDGLNFYPGSHRTLPEAKPIMKKLLQMMQQNPTLTIEIQGHVCCASKPNEDGLDDETGDFKLSWNRAQYVCDYLIQNGIAKERISFRGFAMTRPLVYPEKTIQDQIKNRRVEILVTTE